LASSRTKKMPQTGAATKTSNQDDKAHAAVVTKSLPHSDTFKGDGTNDVMEEDVDPKTS
jgi:hypothetical protein